MEYFENVTIRGSTGELEQSEIVRESLMYKILVDEHRLGFPTKEEGAYFCLDTTIAATESTHMTIWIFVEAMLLHPEIQRKAQAFVDKSVGARVPQWSDYEELPYVHCLIKEVFRWRTAIGLPHVNTQEIIYDGMRIPAGSYLYINAWALQRDPCRHEQPDEFVPERYEHDNTSTMQFINLSDNTKRDHFTFGAGRRVCLGYNTAEHALAVAFMRILWAFDVKPTPMSSNALNNLEWRQSPFL